MDWGQNELGKSVLEEPEVKARTAAVALAIAVVGVAGVLAFSVSARTREFGIRLALGSQPQHLLRSVIAEGAVMAAAGVLAGAVFGFVLDCIQTLRTFLETCLHLDRRDTSMHEAGAKCIICPGTT